MHGIGKVVTDIHRHPDIGLTRAQSLGNVVLCPYRLIDSSHLASLLAAAHHAGCRSENLATLKQFAIVVDRSDRPLRGFSPGKTTPRDLCQTTVIAKLL